MQPPDKFWISTFDLVEFGVVYQEISLNVEFPDQLWNSLSFLRLFQTCKIIRLFQVFQMSRKADSMLNYSIQETKRKACRQRSAILEPGIFVLQMSHSRHR